MCNGQCRILTYSFIRRGISLLFHARFQKHKQKIREKKGRIINIFNLMYRIDNNKERHSAVWRQICFLLSHHFLIKIAKAKLKFTYMLVFKLQTNIFIIWLLPLRYEEMLIQLLKSFLTYYFSLPHFSEMKRKTNPPLKNFLCNGPFFSPHFPDMWGKEGGN